ncbi:MAG: murein biosynthesis integral membrane protein MurJ [Anaerolineaceae bacterium]|nr:murein biosynthesis integral membrane protein MurJ [Anaerolineaceae bacterium]MDD4578702.1 murein biosynthesis integral membrane protein MurJ [Anaerolineaceae bacterium]
MDELDTKPTPPKTDTRTAGQQIARAATVVMLAYIVSTLVGILRGMVISSAFGTSIELDAYNAANRVTELLFNLTAGGALGSAFIPMFTGMLTRKRTQDAWKLASGVINALLVILVGVTALMWIFAPVIVDKVLYALVENANLEMLGLTVRLLRTMLPTVIIFGVSGLVMGTLNAHQVFLWPALAPAMYSLGQIAGVLLLPQSMGVQRLAVGAVIGALGHLLLQVPSLFRLPNRFYEKAAGFKDAAVRQVLKLMVPRIIGAGVVQLNFVANTIIGLSLGAGSASALTWAFTIMLMPQAAIAQSAGTASLPTLSAQVELGQSEQFKQTLAGIIRVMLLLALPATVGLILLRVPIIRVLYERGSFDSSSTQMVAWALLWYAVGLTGHSLVEVLSRAFYAMHDTKTPVIVGVLAMTGNILLSLLFAWGFGEIGWLPLGGLALANSLATAVECLVLLEILRKRLKGLEGRQILNTSLQALLGSVVMGLALFGWITLFGDRNKYIVLVGGVFIGLLAYVAMMLLLKVPELQTIILRIRSKLARRG